MLKERFIIPHTNPVFFGLALIIGVVLAIVYPVLLLNLTSIIPPKIWKSIAFIPSGFLVFFALKFLKEGNTGMMIFFAVLFLFSLLVSFGLGNIFDEE